MGGRGSPSLPRHTVVSLLVLSPPAAPLGALPPASAIAGLSTVSVSGPVSSTEGVTATATSAGVSLMGLHALLAGNGDLTNTGSKVGASQQEAVVLSSALPPVAPKLAAKIKSGVYVPMKDILVDKMSLCSQVEALPTQQIFSV